MSYEKLKPASDVDGHPVIQSQWDAVRDQLAAVRAWYDAEYPPEEGHDQVYPWDHHS